MTEFTDLGLSPTTLQAVADTGYTTATPIQAQAIPIALAGGDVLGIAQTGTGKTAAFTLPMIDKLAAGRAKARMPRALVIAPTRELADQVAASFEKYAKGTKLSWALLIGGVSFGDQEKKLDRGVDVLIATPGRLLDHFERGKLLMTGVQIMVIDEADRMLDMGFIPDIERIFKMTPPRKQTLFFSATMPPEITRLTKQFLNNPTRIEVARPATTNANITQHLVRLPVTDAKAKRTALRMLIEQSQPESGIVFCNRKTDVDIVAKSLKVHGFNAAPIHGDLDQTQRMKTLADFRSGELKILVASDVAARGLDIPAVSHVYNYDVPHHADDYVHRIGRTGRAGRTGETFMIVTPADDKGLDKVLKLIGMTPNEMTLDADWTSIKDERRERSGGKERGGRERGGRDRDRSRGRGRSQEDAPAETATIEAGEQSEVTPAKEPRGRSRGSDRTRGRGRVQDDAVADPFTAEAAGDQPVIGAQDEQPPRPRRERGRRRGAAASEAQAEAAPTRMEEPREPAAEQGVRPVRGVRAPAPRDDDDRRVVGFGADVPAFLQRAPRPLAKADA